MGDGALAFGYACATVRSRARERRESRGTPDRGARRLRPPLAPRAWGAVATIGLAALLLTGGRSLAYPALVSPYSLPRPDSFNRTPHCPVSAQRPYCLWTKEPPYDPGDPESYGPNDYWQNCAYWTAEKRPDVEQLAVQRYGYPAAPGGAADWKPDAVRAGYPVDHTPRVGDVAVWVPAPGPARGLCRARDAKRSDRRQRDGLRDDVGPRSGRHRVDPRQPDPPALVHPPQAAHPVGTETLTTAQGAWE